MISPGPNDSLLDADFFFVELVRLIPGRDGIDPAPVELKSTSWIAFGSPSLLDMSWESSSSKAMLCRKEDFFNGLGRMTEEMIGLARIHGQLGSEYQRWAH
jgi:hypothetical protein